MIKKYYILVEGIADLSFFRDYLIYFFGKECRLIKNKIKEKEIEIEYQNIKIKIIVSGGCNAVAKFLKTKLEELKDFGYQIIIIQDADNPHKQDGGIENRTNFLNRVKKDLNIDFDFFLLPNNKDDGDLETLLLNIAQNLKFAPFYKNYKNYALELSTFSRKEFGDELLQDKQVIFNYIQAYNGMEKSKEENRNFENMFWNFASSNLNNLNNFFENKIK